MYPISFIPLVDRDEWIIEQCRGKRVLHIGCTDWPMTASRIEEGRLLHTQLLSVGQDVVGLDTDAEGIARLRELLPTHEFFVHNAENLQDCSGLRSRVFDVIVAADVIEHLSNVGLFLAGVKTYMTPATELLITTPHAYSIKRMFLMFLGYEHVHDDHTAYFSLSTLKRILGRFGFEIASCCGFQWKNPTARNRLAYLVSLPVLWLTRGRTCDELALLVKSNSPLAPTHAHAVNTASAAANP